MAVISKWSLRQNKATVKMCPRHILGTPLSRTVRLKFPVDDSYILSRNVEHLS